ncbi:ChaN family lipoprotein [Roseospira navarrensis]|uniref:Haem-binding uptake Tiki superfamily ChaN domain-containing protein n=1 Tax=Roseospira navarrensis TaxID=140058 RepID=A0A7X1ZB26_9PROT|nr:ChaN family lipoprotein [Roseospira navarrensis]MQX35279.1 hypothetical protein [Roseospira navarrensis]
MTRPGRTALPLLLCSALVAGGSASALAAAPPWDGAWQTTIRADHPMVGAVVDPGTGARLDPASLAARLAGADVVLLGEKHDNPDHHAAQAWLLGLMTEAGRRPAVVMEMLDTGQADALAGFLARDDVSAADLGPAVAWADSGWPDWAQYQPIAEVALAADLPILTGNLPTGDVRRVASEGAEAVVGPEGLAPRALDSPLPDRLSKALGQEILRGHCDMLPESALPGMIAAQRARDGEMARALLAGRALDATDGAVLIAGNGHVRADRAVPWYLDRLAPQASALVVGILETPADLPDAPTAADLRSDDGAESADRRPFDLILFTPALEDVDPCEKFRAQLERMRAAHGGDGESQQPEAE